jgi:hypothetical protein
MPGPRGRSLLLFTTKFLIVSFWGIRALNAQGAPASETEKIQGTVLNRLTHEPIERALVYSPDNRFATMTDGRGRFVFEIPADRPSTNGVQLSAQRTVAFAANRPYSLMARKPGFLPMDNPQDGQLNPDQKELTLYLDPEGFIVGNVSLPTPERITVQLCHRQIQDGRARWIQMKSVSTRSDGTFRFAELAPGAYRLFTLEFMDRDPLTFNPRGQLYGYPPLYYPSANNFAAAETIDLPEGGTFHANLSPARREYYPVEISVLNVPNGVPVQVSVFVAGQEGPGYSLGYNMEKQAIEGSLPSGTYTVEVSSFGPASASGTANITVGGGPAKGQTLMLAPNPSVTVKLTEAFTSAEANSLQPGFGVVSKQGVNFNGDGQHRGRYVQVALESADEFGQGRGAGLRPPSGPEDESLVIENIQPGRYWVRVDSSRGYAASVSSGGVNLLTHPLVVAAGASAPAIEVVMRDDGAQIEGTVESVGGDVGSAANASQKPAHVYIIPVADSPGQFREIWSSFPDGKFSSQQIPPGEYRVLAFERPQPDLEYRDEQAMRKLESKGQLVRLLPGQKEQLRLHRITETD